MQIKRQARLFTNSFEYIALFGAILTSGTVTQSKASLLWLCLFSLLWGVVLAGFSLTKLRKQSNTPTALIARAKFTAMVIIISMVLCFGVVAIFSFTPNMDAIKLISYYLILLSTQSIVILVGTAWKRD